MIEEIISQIHSWSHKEFIHFIHKGNFRRTENQLLETIVFIIFHAADGCNSNHRWI